MYFFRATSPSTILSISGCISGSPPGNRNHRRAALLDRLEALFRSQVHFQNMRRVLNLAASGAGQIAAEQGFEHQDQRIPLVPGRALAEHITHDRPHLRDGYTHSAIVPLVILSPAPFRFSGARCEPTVKRQGFFGL